MTRDELILRTRQLVAEGERLSVQPSMDGLRVWLQLSDELLSTAWGTMDRYHLAWLLVGKPPDVVRGRPMTAAEADAYVRLVAGQKTAALRMSLDAVERQGMPFLGEEGGVGGGQGMGRLPDAADAPGDRGAGSDGETDAGPPAGRFVADPALEARLADARRRAEAHADHDRPRAPRPERMQR